MLAHNVERAAGTPLVLGDLCVEASDVLELRVCLPNGTPVQYPRVFVQFAARGAFRAPELPPSVGDALGRIRLALPAAGDILLCVFDGEGNHALVQINGATTAQRQAQIPEKVTLAPAQPITGRIVDAEHHPMAGVGLGVYRSTSGGGGEHGHATHRLNRILLEGRTDQDGRFRLWFVPLPRTNYGVMARTARGSPAFTVPDDVEREVELLIR